MWRQHKLLTPKLGWDPRRHSQGSIDPVFYLSQNFIHWDENTKDTLGVFAIEWVTSIPFSDTGYLMLL